MLTVLEVAQARIPELKKKTANEWAGPCPYCGGTDRFLVWTHRDAWHCRGCQDTGDMIKFFMKFDGMNCPSAHEAAGENCTNRDCPAWDKCRLGARANGETPQKRKKERQPLTPPMPKEEPAFVPDTAETPQQKWQQQAAALIEKAHDKLLDSQEQIDYLTARGLPIEAIRAGRLGLLPADRFPAREAWGLPTEWKENNQRKKLLIPCGILIPFFDADGNPHRIRIRRFNPPTPKDRYFWLKGSGNDVPVIGKIRRGVVVVESDIDAFMVRWQCRDLDVCVIPLGTCGVKPKSWAMQALEQALCILVAHDFEPRINEKTGKPENPGGQGAKWWLNQFKRAKRWPVPEGKDPGEYYQDHGGDIRQWILEGLPPVFHVAAKAPKQKAPPAEPIIPAHVKGTTVNGHDYVIAADPQHVNRLRMHYPQAVVFTQDEIEQLKGMEQAEAETILLAKKVYGGTILETKEIDHTTDPVPLPDEPEAVQGEMGF